MDNKEFAWFRKNLQKTQKQMAQLLGTSLKAIHSYEQGWRRIPPGVERQMFFLVANKRGNNKPKKSCWTIKNCPPRQREKCPAWEFQSGKMCWFVSGTICSGEVQESWEEKMKTCRSCDVLKAVIDNLEKE
ncbi:MAG: transcriptional regulator [Deltaproteobacteria bacterium]|nr:transcriptional regulator [Deltaproteobacteria bacterium]MBW2176859.1 transcriptional regulator [Deltaproteobacteria bacterium]